MNLTPYLSTVTGNGLCIYMSILTGILSRLCVVGMWECGNVGQGVELGMACGVFFPGK